MAAVNPAGRRLRLLVAIASYGERQLEYLKRIIRNYEQMTLDVDVVVFSEAAKDLGSKVEVVIGLPSSNPWSLPFAHKQFFADNVERYDLFLYSEDDILVTEANIQAFLRLTPTLADEEVAGFLHYEKDAHGGTWMVCVHRHFHWKADSVRRRGENTVAEFSNEHSACYLLTQSQLRRAIASGGFLRPPHEGQYDMLCAAATDPYTNCGFRKVICVSALEDFMVHHLPDKYVGQLDVPLDAFQEQVKTLLRIGSGEHPARNLCEITARFRHFWWQKSYYEKPDEELLGWIRGNQAVLSIGCGWGATEATLKERGATVTALPLDSIIGETAARRGAEVIHGNWDECRAALNGRSFDCVLMTDLLHLHPNPGQFVQQCCGFVKKGGILVLGGPNFDRLPWYLKRVCGSREFRKLRSFDLSGISVCGPRTLSAPIMNAGLRVADVRWLNHEFGARGLRGKQIRMGWLTARNWVLRAERL